MIKHDPTLFEDIYGDAKTHFGDSYDGLWKGRVKISEFTLKNFPKDMQSFRSNWCIAKGYTDSFCIDPLNSLPLTSLKMKLFYRLAKTGLGHRALAFSRLAAERMQKDSLRYRNYYYEHMYGDILKKMIDRVPNMDMLAGGSHDYTEIAGRKVSIRHLYTLLRLYDLEQKMDLNKVETVIEVGGGFGVNVETMMELYPNIRKYVLIDIPSCLYTATLYLKSKYGDQVKTYSDTKSVSQIDLNSKEREIYAIPPWKVDALSGNLDLFINLFSFQVFSQDNINMYSRLLKRLAHDRSAIWLGGYEVPSSLKQEEVLACFEGSMAFQSVPYTEKDKHGETTWFYLGKNK